MAREHETRRDGIAGHDLRVCLVGPESTGKTTLAEELAAEQGAGLVTEVARGYLATRSGYDRADLLEIARRQIRSEVEASRRRKPGTRIICDTDVLVICVWWEEKFGPLPEALRTALEVRSPRVYLLTRPDLPWEADPLRENPHDRARLFDRYLSVLEDGDFPFGIVEGTGEARLDCARRELTRLTGA